MPKMKTNKGVKKRLKVTGTGKIKHRRSGGGHLLSNKSGKRQRKLGKAAIMAPMMAKHVKIALGCA